jgi:peptidoglycan/xylan/chitin deacetylase (PgdA/CDA1 family)
VSPRWNWDFNEGSRARSSPVSAGPTAPPDRRAQLRRRRGAALVALALIAAVVLVSVLGTSHGSNASTPATGAGAGGLANASGARPATMPASSVDAVKDVLSYTPFVTAGGARGREVALTFDDGPGPYTPAVLSVLESNHAPATFFAIGKMERYFSASTQREIRDGDAVGDHTQSHPALARLAAHEQHEEMFEGILRIELAGGPRPQLFRPPYGSFNATTLRELHSLGLLMVLWSVDTNDYRRPGVSVIVERVLAGARPGAIFLLHDGGGDRSQTVAALPAIIRGLRARGLELVTVPKLLRDDPPPSGQPIPSSLAGD